MIHNRRSNDVGKDGLRYHTWPVDEMDIGFEDTIIISDESISDAQLRKMPYSLWTTAHEQDELYIAGERSKVFAACENFFILTKLNSPRPTDPFQLGPQYVSESRFKWKYYWSIPRR